MIEVQGEETDKLSLKKALKLQFVSWCTDSTSHGIPHIAKSRNIFMKIIWTIFFLVSFTYCSYTIFQSFIVFLNYKVSLRISHAQDLPGIFPAVTICNLNALNERYASYKINQTITEINNQGPDNAFKIHDQVRRHIANDKILTDYERYYYGYHLRYDMRLRCSFNKILCYENNFTQYWDNQYGNCYTFNKGNDSVQPLKSSTTGESNGLNFELLVSKYKLIIN